MLTVTTLDQKIRAPIFPASHALPNSKVIEFQVSGSGEDRDQLEREDTPPR